jgi:hypothetical protein
MMKISLSGLSNEYQTSWKFSVLRGKNKTTEKKNLDYLYFFIDILLRNKPDNMITKSRKFSRISVRQSNILTLND